jgi:hypothetical protein
VFKIKPCAITASAVFILSFLLNLFRKWPHIGLALLWAGVFGAVFFGLVLVIQWLVQRFLPELLEDSPRVDDSPGSLVNITVEDEAPPTEPSPAEPDFAPMEIPVINAPDSKENLHDLENNAIPGLDQEINSGYNTVEEESSSLPELEAMSRVFGMDSGEKEKTGTFLDMDGDALAAELLPKPAPTQPVAGRFDPHEMAQAVQTILRRDGEG